MPKQRMNPYILVGGFLLTAGLLAIFASGFGKDPRALPSMLEGKPAPAFSLVDLEGHRWSSDDLRGKTVVINFWSTWCLPCKQEHPLLLKAQRLWPQVQFLGVVFSDTQPKVEALLRKDGQAYSHLMDPGGRMAIDYGVAGVPETYFIDSKGIIVHKAVGPVSEQLLITLLGPPEGP